MCGVAVAQAQVGRISGKVTSEAGEALAFANVMIEGTRLGAAADVNGNYTIANVPVGSHTVVANAVGYKRQAVTVQVIADQTVTADFKLAEDVLRMGEVVSTGTYSPRQKLESTVAVSTLTPRELTLANPRSTTEVLRYIPGFTRVESSGGEVNQNITMRGILGVEYVMFMEDGLPVFPTMHTFFMNADNLFRMDENIERVEVVRGGNSALFGSNTPGAIVNFINKTGGPDLGGTLKVWGATQGLARYDLNLNGPLGQDWTFSLGGFYRYDHGVRDPGFPGIAGGQVKANVTRLLNNGYVRASLKIIDDRNQFILPLPFQNPDNPDYVPGFSDYGSMNTNEGNHIRVPIPTGELELPLENGLRTRASWLTADVGFNFPDDWSIQNTAQIMQNDQEWNAIVPFDVVKADDWFASLGYPAGSTYRLFYTNHRDASGNKLPFDRSSNNGLALVAPGGEWHVEKPLNAFQNQFQVKKSYKEHNFSLGVYFANYSQTNRWFFTDILTDVRDNPRFLDLVVYTPTDTIQATKNGFRKFLSNYVNGTGTTTIISGVLGGELKLTDHLRADFGFRYESNSFVQTSENTSPVDLDGNPNTPYDRESWGNGTFRHFSRTINDWAASIGFNYKVSDEWTVYVQGSRAYKMPALDEFLVAAAQEQVELFEARRTYMGEGGVKYATDIFAGTLTGFYGEIRNNIGQGLEVNPATGQTFWAVRTFPNSRAYGAELELSVTPTRGLRLMGVATLLTSKSVEPGGSALTAGGIPSTVANVSATYSVSGLSFLADWHFVGKRDIIDADYDPQTKKYRRYNDVGDLKAYHYLNLGASYTFPGQAIRISADLLNVYQSKGFEEGNPRLIATGGNPLFLARPILPRRFVGTVSYQF
jgi:outer membrane receptor protein involved in Fe transport